MSAHLLLLVGLLVFLGSHSLRIVAPAWREAQVARLGEQRWKDLFSVVSLASFVLLAWAWGQTRSDPLVLWVPPLWARHVASSLVLPAFILLVAAYVPRNGLKARVGHPMVAGTKLWALAHLIANGNLGDVMLFGGFLVWAVFDFVSARRRDRAAGVVYPAGSIPRTAAAVAIGLVAFWLFARYAHLWLFGAYPFATT